MSRLFRHMRRIRDKKERTGGFTLTELIVVLVILAVLAAIMVPALLGWIDKAKNKGDILTMNLVTKAVKSAYAEMYGENPASVENLSIISNQEDNNDASSVFRDRLQTYLSDVDINWQTDSANKYIILIHYKNKVWSITLSNIKTYKRIYYYEGNGKVIITDNWADLPADFVVVS